VPDNQATFPNRKSIVESRICAQTARLCKTDPAIGIRSTAAILAEIQQLEGG
jgi:hypothetical protein